MWWCMHAYLQKLTSRTLKTLAYLKMDIRARPYKCCSFRIGTLVVVQKRAVIEYQTRVCLVVAKDVIINGLRLRQVVGQI